MTVKAPPLAIDTMHVELETFRAERAGRNRNRIARPVTKPHVGEINTFRQFDAQYEMIGVAAIAEHLAHHRSGGARDVEPQLAERPAEHSVHLVTPAAAALLHDLLV